MSRHYFSVLFWKFPFLIVQLDQIPILPQKHKLSNNCPFATEKWVSAGVKSVFQILYEWTNSYRMVHVCPVFPGSPCSSAHSSQKAFCLFTSVYSHVSARVHENCSAMDFHVREHLFHSRVSFFQGSEFWSQTLHSKRTIHNWNIGASVKEAPYLLFPAQNQGETIYLSIFRISGRQKEGQQASCTWLYLILLHVQSP